MIHLYPGNKTEGLLLLLNQISKLSPLGVFEQEVIVVENPGMQHWLNLSIAKERNISMNIRYALPAQFLWGLLRTLASEENVPEQSPYLREVLAWRIYALLATKEVITDSDFAPATRYWLDNYTSFMSLDSLEETQNQKSVSASFNRNENLKRYQLSVQLADLYEQYLIFRPQWLNDWQHGIFDVNAQQSNSTSHFASDSLWQGKLWQLLVKQAPYNPVELLDNAIANIAIKLEKDKSILPTRISFFGINSMAPMWLNFINALSEHVEVHFYHLNPCFAYWGDIVSEKEALKKLQCWSDGVENEHLFVGNPLLASLGQQGREFLSLLQQVSTIDVELFVEASSAQQDTDIKGNNIKSKSVLHAIQNDILALEDARLTKDVKPYPALVHNEEADDSITIASCHSALREVQALHDYLLHQFNSAADQGEALCPKDILVMCPQIEHYAPYVNAVFTRGWQDISHDLPPLPCSIADRSAKDSDPLIAAFSDLLNLPDSRFQVSQLLGFIRLPAMANKFELDAQSLVKVSTWLNDASIHWGIDGDNKTHIIGEVTNANFTWQQGLSRLLRGFAYADSEHIYQNQLLLSQVEGDDALLLGRLILLIEQLQLFSIDLQKPRNAKDWQTFLLSQLELLFSISNNQGATSSSVSQTKEKLAQSRQNVQIENSLTIINKAISGLVEYCEHAKFNDEIDLAIVVDYLTHHFSQGDASKQFMVGQVTFCSMLPMRSIPFKIIAVLGLNDGEFPRQRVPLGFDLMANAKATLGDRSRRGDDRYLFLEALISARQSLYLSYQGRNIKNNSEKQPSIVLKELMSYLEQGYGWVFEGEKSAIKQLPMQAFSEDNYAVSMTDNIHCNDNDLNNENASQKAVNKTNIKPSFDINWLKLAQTTWPQPLPANEFIIPVTISNSKINTSNEPLQRVEFDQLVRFFQNPSKVFAQQQLNLYLDNYDVVIEDIEPFTEDYLQSYLLKQDLLNAYLALHVQKNNDSVEQVIEKAHLCGKFPDLPSTQNDFDRWVTDNELFCNEIIEQNCDNPQFIEATVDLAFKQDGETQSSVITIMVKFPVKQTSDGVKIVHYRTSSAKPKDKFQLYLLQLLIQQWQSQQIANSVSRNATSTVVKLPGEEERILAQVSHTTGFYFNTKSQKTEQFNVTDIESSKEKLQQLMTAFIKGQTQPLLLNGDIAAEVFATKRGKPIEITQSSFEVSWQGSQSKRGFSEDAYLHYFWPQCPNIEEFKAEFINTYKGLYDAVSKG